MLLRKNKQLAVKERGDIAQRLFRERLQIQDTSTEALKSSFIQDFKNDLNNAICSIDNGKTFSFGMTVVSVVGSLALLLTLPVFTPAGLLLIPTLASCGTYVGLKIKKDSGSEGLISTLMRYHICLSAQPLGHWGYLWDMAGDDLFIQCLPLGATGDLVGNEVHQLVPYYAQVKEAILSILNNPNYTPSIQEIAPATEVTVTAVEAVATPAVSADEAALKMLLEKLGRTVVPLIPEVPVAPVPSADEVALKALLEKYGLTVTPTAPEVPVTPISTSYSLPSEALTRIVETEKPSLVQLLESSEIASILKIGILKVIGGQGSGKTTLVNGGLLRYRVAVKHKLIIINSHKSFDMYKGLESHLEEGTSFYGVGSSDTERAISLIKGLNEVLLILEDRYNEYQNQPEGTFNHYPITILIEECGEWAGLLGKERLPLIQHFWQKMFISCRKAKLFPIITAQNDTMTMFGNPVGLAELIQNTGAGTLELFATADNNSADGWRPTGEGALFMPRVKPLKVNIPDIRTLIPNPDIFTDVKPLPKTEPTPPVVEVLPTVEPKFSNAVQKLENSLKLNIEKVVKDSVEETSLSLKAASVSKWLGDNCPNKWIKFKGKDKGEEKRNGNFTNFLSDIGLKGMERDEVISELALAEYIELSEDGQYLCWTD